MTTSTRIDVGFVLISEAQSATLDRAIERSAQRSHADLMFENAISPFQQRAGCRPRSPS